MIATFDVMANALEANVFDVMANALDVMADALETNVLDGLFVRN